MDQEQYIEFGIEEESFAIPIQDIHEIIKMQELNQIPNVRSYVMGVINLRGQVVPIISLRRLFNLPDDKNTKATRIVVVNHREESVGIIVDSVNHVITFSDIQPPPNRIGGIDSNYLVAIGFTDSNRLVGILKLDEVLVKQEHFQEGCGPEICHPTTAESKIY